MNEREYYLSKIGKEVKLVERDDNFVHYGKIIEVNDNSIIFVTKNGESLIKFDVIGSCIERW